MRRLYAEDKHGAGAGVAVVVAGSGCRAVWGGLVFGEKEKVMRIIRAILSWLFPVHQFPLQRMRQQLGTEYQEPKRHWRMVE